MHRAAALALIVLVPLAGLGPAAGDDLIGAASRYRVAESDTLVRLTQTLRVGYVELLAANPGVHPWLPGGGTEITLPTQHLVPDAPRTGLVLNLAELRLYFFPANGGPAESFAVGIGRDG